MLHRYEILFLTGPYLTSLEASSLEQNITNTLRSFDAKLISYERWGKYQLAYQINNFDYGVYFLIRFEAEKNATELFAALKELFKIKLDDVVMRHIINRLDPKQSLEYSKPESLEDAPKQQDRMRSHYRRESVVEKQEMFAEETHAEKDLESEQELAIIEDEELTLA
jgi:small subunit ribosomal protein S6